jgi:Fe2+ or Zn2+ uptake regulation protein
MSIPHAPAPDVISALHALRSRGLRASATRRLVLEVLFSADGPVTAEEVAGGLGGRLPSSDLGSVYRNLDTLEREGVIARAHVGHGPGLFAPRCRRPHAIACCERCGERRVIGRGELAALRVAIRRATGLEPAFGHFGVVGLCESCVSS